jgi:hypothetical protein
LISTGIPLLTHPISLVQRHFEFWPSLCYPAYNHRKG